MIDWCCAQFGDRYGDEGARGLSIISRARKCDIYPQIYPVFLVKFRSIDIENENKFPPTDFVLSKTVTTGIIFCPWCGVDLSEYYLEYMSELDCLIEED